MECILELESNRLWFGIGKKEFNTGQKKTHLTFYELKMQRAIGLRGPLKPYDDELAGTRTVGIELRNLAQKS